jgi:riboflavin kinase / FMN adenylyltransferase
LTFSFHRHLADLSRLSGGAVVTVGTFDGIHVGHQAILTRVNEYGKQHGLTPVVVTFHPHPRVVISPDNYPPLLTTLDEKEHFLPCFHDGAVVVLEFNSALKELSAEEFARQILVDRLGAKRLIVGYDHAFGKNRGGGVAELRRIGQEMGFEVEVVEPVLVDGSPVSSSRIRTALTENRLREAVHLLGHEYAIFGTVERGIGLGRKLGYPTANVKYGDDKLLPFPGVYACRVAVEGDQKMGMMFIGHNHFNAAKAVTVEANLFEFDRDIYDAEISVVPTHFVREGRKFDSTQELKDQMANDKTSVLRIIGKGETTCQ